MPSRHTDDLFRLVSEQILTENSKNPISLLDQQAITQYQDTQALVEQQLAMTTVKQEFER